MKEKKSHRDSGMNNSFLSLFFLSASQQSMTFDNSKLVNHSPARPKKTPSAKDIKG